MAGDFENIIPSEFAAEELRKKIATQEGVQQLQAQQDQVALNQEDESRRDVPMTQQAASVPMPNGAGGVVNTVPVQAAPTQEQQIPVSAPVDNGLGTRYLQSTDASVKTKDPLSKEAMARIQSTQDQARIKANEAIAAKFEADREMARVQGESAKATAEKMEADANARALRNKQFFDKQKNEIEALNKTTTELASTKIDPNRLWSNMGTGNQIAVGIAFALGALGGGDSNKAIAVFQKAVDRDIAAQNADMANKFKSVEVKQNLVKQMTDIFGDAEKGQAAAEITMYKAIENKLNQQIANTNLNQTAKANAMNTVAQVQQTLADKQIAFEELQRKEKITDTSTKFTEQTVDPKMMMEQSKFVMDIRKDAEKKYALDDKRKSFETTEDILKQIDAGSSFGENSAQYSMIKSFMTGVISDRDAAAMGLERGVIEKAKATISKWSGGPLTKEQRDSVEIFNKANKAQYEKARYDSIQDTIGLSQRNNMSPIKALTPQDISFYEQYGKVQNTRKKLRDTSL